MAWLMLEDGYMWAVCSDLFFKVDSDIKLYSRFKEKFMNQKSISHAIFALILTVAGLKSNPAAAVEASSENQKLPEIMNYDEDSLKSVLMLIVRPDQKEKLREILAKKKMSDLNASEKKMIRNLINEGVRIMVNAQQPIY
jgi:hypothetical protein